MAKKKSKNAQGKATSPAATPAKKAKNSMKRSLPYTINGVTFVDVTEPGRGLVIGLSSLPQKPLPPKIKIQADEIEPVDEEAMDRACEKTAKWLAERKREI